MSGTIGGYPGHHASNPFILPQLLEATNNCVRNFCRVKPEENVLIVSEFDTDPVVTACFAASAKEAGGNIVMATVEPMAAGGWMRGTPNDMLVAAFEKSDVVIACTYFEFAHNEKTFFDRIFGSKHRVCSVLMGSTPGSLLAGGKFPVPLFEEIAKKVHGVMSASRTVRYTTASGTDVTFEGLQGLGYSKALTPGSWAIFPPMGINFYPENANGVLVFDESTITGRPSSPIKITISNNFATNVEGGSQAERHAIETFANGRYYVRHTVVGLNPKVRTVNAPQFERERAAGTAYLGRDGTGPSGQIDRTKPGYSHLDMIFDTPTVLAGDQTIVKDRRLMVLEDPGLKEFAKQYGDPERVLAQNPFIW